MSLLPVKEMGRQGRGEQVRIPALALYYSWLSGIEAWM